MKWFPFRIEEENRYYLRDLLILSGVISIAILAAELIHFRNSENLDIVDRILIYVYYTVPLVVLFLIISYFYRNRRNLETGRLKSSIRYRLSLSFLFIAMLPSFPVFLLTSNVIGRVFEGFYGLDIAQALEAGDHFVKKELDLEKNNLLEKAKLFRNLVQRQNPNPNLLTNRANELDLISNPNYYVGWYENNIPALENRSLKLSVSPQEFTNFGTEGISEKLALNQNLGFYLLKIDSLNPSKFLILGKRVFQGEESKAYSFINTRKNYITADLAKENFLMKYGLRSHF